MPTNKVGAGKPLRRICDVIPLDPDLAPASGSGSEETQVCRVGESGASRTASARLSDRNTGWSGADGEEASGSNSLESLCSRAGESKASTLSKARTISPQVGNRSLGFLERALPMTDCSPEERDARLGRACRCWSESWRTVRPRNGRVPVSISWYTIARPYWSE